MKLFVTPTSPYARKCRIVARELDLMRLIEEVCVDLADKAELRKFNPLGKIPALELDDGSVLIDSPVICEFLDDLGGGKYFPGVSLWRSATGRWRALALQALGDGICEAAVARVIESRRPEETQDKAAIERHLKAIEASLDALERTRFAEPFAIGEIAAACAIGYLDFREVIAGWRETRPKLAAWYEAFAKHPSMKATWPANPT